jgi:hypothetical protein
MWTMEESILRKFSKGWGETIKKFILRKKKLISGETQLG